MLTAVRFSRKTEGRKYYWVFKCDCGVVKEMRVDTVKRKNHVSCGCWNREKKSNYSHGFAPAGGDNRTYKSWQMMKARCLYPSHISYKNYGGRGITVCDRWTRFENFLADMGERPDEKTLERIDVNGNYEKSNCKWATTREQKNNTRRNVYIAFDCRYMTLAQWAEHLSMSKSKLWYRIRKAKWPLKRALASC